MTSLDELQTKSQLWREHSFPPEHRTAPLQALGVCEEAGELAHSILKMEQQIRGNTDYHIGQAEDAVGDIIIYLAGLCTSLGVSLQKCVDDAWAGVQKRDWSKYKNTGHATEGAVEGPPRNFPEGFNPNDGFDRTKT